MIVSKKIPNVLETKWFHPPTLLDSEVLLALAQKHQERIKPFGLRELYPIHLISIWPGVSPQDILEKHKECKTSLLQMFVDTGLQTLREIHLQAGKLTQVDGIVRDLHNKMTSIVKKAAIDASGLTVHATRAVPIGKGKETDISDLDIIEKACEDGLRVASCYVSWCIASVEIGFAKKYLNPFTPLMQLYDLGVWPLGLVKKRYWILVPGEATKIQKDQKNA